MASAVVQDSGDAAVFFTWAAVGLLLAGGSVYAARRHSDTAGFVLAPTLILALVWENLALAIAASAGPTTAVGGVLALRGAVHSFIIPLFLVTLFELNYTVHKRRSSNFFCIVFDQGHRAAASALSHLLRYSMWLVALAVLLLQVVCNSTYTSDPLRAPHTARFTFKGLGLGPGVDGGGTGSGGSGGAALGWQEVTDFFPWLILFVFSFYTGLSLWRYGTTMSTDVRASAVNPWGAVFLATGGLAAAWLLTPHAWRVPYATNIMELGLAAGIVVTVHLVEVNLRTLESWGRILQLANEALLVAQARKEEAEAMLREQQEAAAMAAAAAAGSDDGMGAPPAGGALAGKAGLRRGLGGSSSRLVGGGGGAGGSVGGSSRGSTPRLTAAAPPPAPADAAAITLELGTPSAGGAARVGGAAAGRKR
jgi:hypothetical protein